MAHGRDGAADRAAPVAFAPPIDARVPPGPECAGPVSPPLAGFPTRGRQGLAAPRGATAWRVLSRDRFDPSGSTLP